MKRTTFLLLILLFVSSIRISAQSDTLIVGYSPAPPFLIDSGFWVQGVNIWLWERIAKDLDLHFTLKEMDFDDMMTGLKEGSIDVSINPLTLTPERATYMHFTSPFYVSNSAAVVLNSTQNEIISFFKKFFAWEFITGMALLTILVGIFGFLTWLFERKSNPEFRKNIKGLWDGLWWSAVTMTTVGYGDKAPKSRGGKIVALIWMFIALLFVSGLTAGIASTILSTTSSSRFSTIDDIRSRNVGSVTNTGSLNYLRNRFFRKLKSYENIEEGLDALANKKIEVFIYDKPILTYRLKERNDEDIIMLPLKFNSQLYGFGLSMDNQELGPKLSERILYYTSSLEWPIMLQEYGLQEL